MKIPQLIIICIVAYFLFFKKEGYSYIDLPPICSKDDPALMCKDKRGRYISLTSSSAKDCDEKTIDVQCKGNRGTYQRLTKEQSNKIISDFVSQVKTDIQQPQIQREDTTCDTVNPLYVCNINGRPSRVSPSNAKDCTGLLVCRNKAGTGTRLTKQQSDKTISDFMSQVKTDIQQPQIQREDTTCDTVNPLYVCNINGRPSRVSPANAKDCSGLLVCRNKAGTGTRLTKEQSDKVINDFMSQVKSEVQQPVFDEEYSKKARRCKIPLEERISNGVTLCRNDLPGNESSFIQKPKPPTSPSNYIRLSEL